MIRVGMVGTSPGNGHPFSFSAIVNGYDPDRFADAGWPVIDRYLRRAEGAAGGIDGMEVTHAWTQDGETTRRLRRSCGISGAPDGLEAMAAEVDAAIVARDDWESHARMALVFLERGVPVFVDKPLSLDPDELAGFRPHLEAGRLMSCSAMRFARELDGPRSDPGAYGGLRLVRGAIVLGWEKYGVHLLDAAWGVRRLRPVSVTALPARHDSMAVELEGGGLFEVDCLGEAPRVFRLELFGADDASRHEITDNYTMFRRMLLRFRAMVEDGRPPVPPDEVLDVMRVLVAGRRSGQRGGPVRIAELPI